MLARRLKSFGYIYAGPQSSFRHAEQTLRHLTLIAVESGSFEYEIGAEKAEASFGDLVFCPADVSFKRKALSEITFHHIHFEEIETAATERAYRMPLSGKISIGDVNRLASTYHYLAQNYHGGSEPEDVRSNNIHEHLIPDLLFMVQMEASRADKLRKNIDPIMEQALRLLHRHAYEPYSLKQLADKLGMNPSQLTRSFQAAYKSSPMAYLTRLRMDEARRLLLETDETLESIAFRCGYESGSYFCRLFTAKLGMNPSKYRQNYRV